MASAKKKPETPGLAKAGPGDSASHGSTGLAGSQADLAKDKAAREAARPEAPPLTAPDGAPDAWEVATEVPASVAHTPATGLRKYRVWPHGNLLRDNVEYPPGAELELPEAVAATIPCLLPVE